MPFTAGRLVRRSVWFHRGIGLAVALGVAAATAVVSGALLVGDSMRGSLRGLTLERLGRIDLAVMPGMFFDPARVEGDLQQSGDVVPAIYFARSVVETVATGDKDVRRSGSVQVIAVPPSFWDLDTMGIRPANLPDENSVILNSRTAVDLQVSVGDLVTVRLPAEQAVPADSPLGRRDSESEGLPRLKVVDIIPDEGLGRFGLQPSQTVPLCCYLSIDLVQSALDRAGQANTLLVALKDAPSDGRLDDAALKNLQQSLTPGLQDFGLQLSRVRRTFGDPEEVVFDYYNLTSEQLLLNDRLVEIVRDELGHEHTVPLLTYLANAIETPNGEKSVPYSMLTAIDSTPQLPLDFKEEEATAEPETIPPETIPIVLNSWAASQLGVEPGQPLRVAYYEPETTSGEEVERYFQATLTSIVPITAPSRPFRRSRPAEFDQRPTVYNDPDLTPAVPGVTDQDSINDWDLPFELERETSSEDDDYWRDYRLTPKAFVPLSVGRELFGSRFGNTTGIRIDPSIVESEAQLAARLTAALRRENASLGFAVLPIKAQQLAASRGTTPFDALFLSLSFFVIVAALLLVALLFRLGMEQRAAEYGVLMAVGLPGRRVSRFALTEGVLVALPGAILGVLVGVLYALAVLWALGSFWVGAVTVPFLRFHWTWTSLVGGAIAGIAMASLTVLVTARRLRRAEVRPLLANHIPETKRNARHMGGRGRRWVWPLAVVCCVAAAGLGLLAVGLSGPAQAGAFVGGGMLLLCGILLFAHQRLSLWQATDRRADLSGGYSLSTLALRGIGRNPTRGTLSIGLMAVACFLIVSMSAFQMRPTDKGVGGFDLIGYSAVPLYRDLNDEDTRQELFAEDAEAVAGAKIFALRYRPGQDASCNNLYQATQPQVLGITPQFAQWFAMGTGANGEGAQPVPFDWAASDAELMESTQAKTPWALLAQTARGTPEDPIPVILDQNTAMWSLQMRGGVGEVRAFTFDNGETISFKVVALLANSVLQGSLMISEENFEAQFPAINGYSFLLAQAADSQAEQRKELAKVLENGLSDVGLDMSDSRETLAGLMAVQNTYLKTFQSLGALGLLLGAFGLAVVQLRNVLERRGELALMRAVGFSRRRLLAVVMIENLTLLCGGILCGTGAALAAVVPYMLAAHTRPAIAEPLAMLLLVFVSGLLAGVFALRRVARLPLLESL